jgi:fatty acid desaturase
MDPQNRPEERKTRKLSNFLILTLVSVAYKEYNEFYGTHNTHHRDPTQKGKLVPT